MKLLLLYLLPVITHARIIVNIRAAKDTRNSLTYAIGVSQNIITTDDEKLFNITDQALNKAVFNLVKRAPTNVYLKGPTPWNDLYKTYGWKPVKTVIKPHKVRVVNAKTSSVVLKRRTITNYDTVEKHQNLTMTANIENRVSSTWEESNVFGAGIQYKIDIIGLGKVPKFEFISAFGKNVDKSKTVSIKSGSDKFNMKPKTAASIVFGATEVQLSIEVEYWMKLVGHVVTNNEVRLKGHHFWAYDIISIMRAAKLPYMRKVKELITVQFYSDDNIVVS